MQRVYSEHLQGTSDWLKDRIGYVTASGVHAVMSKGRGASPSRTRHNYMVKMWCEMQSGKPVETYKSDYMQDGNDNEDAARLAYEFATGNTVEQAGLCFIPELKIGASTDGLVGDRGLIEIKNVKPGVQADFLLTGVIDDKYIKQMQTQMFVLDREWCDFVSYSLGDEDGELPNEYKLKIVRVDRDEKLIEEIKQATASFHDDLLVLDSKLKESIKEK